MRLEFNDAEQSALAEADRLEAAAKTKRQEAFDARNARDEARPLEERLIFAATARCDCGHGVAYDPTGKVATDNGSPFRSPSAWECSAILLGIASDRLKHCEPLPFAFWEIKSEGQGSASGASTREPGPPNPAVNGPEGAPRP